MSVLLYRYLKKQYQSRQHRNLQPDITEQYESNPSTSVATLPETSEPKSQNNIDASHPTASDNSKARKYRWKLVLCLTPGFVLSSLDLTIVASALPFIASHFDKLNQLNWIVTAFTLTSTAFIPVFGQLSDTFGRHAILQLAIWILTIGSILCAAAPDWPVLLLGRALQGMGSAGIQNITLIVLADSVSLREQAINTSIFQLLNGVGYSVGPVIGGYITNADWRYIFVLSIGLGVFSSATTIFLRKDLKQGAVSVSHPTDGVGRGRTLLTGLSTLDYGGVVLFIFSIGLIILGTAWGGSTFAWDSAAVLVSLILGAVLFLCFCVWEYLLEPGNLLSRHFQQTKPLVPFDLLRKKDIGLVCFIDAAAGAALYSVFYFIGIYFTLVEAYPASKAGVQLLYYVPGIGVGVYSVMVLCNFWPRQTFWPLFIGSVIETAGIATLTYAVKARNSTLVNVMMGIAGAGTGARFMPSNLHLGGMFRNRIAPVYSLMRFSLPFGGTIALTIMGSVFQNKMSTYFGAINNSGSGGFNLHNDAALSAINQLPVAEQAQIRSTGADATMWAFISILPILGLSVVASLGLGNVWIASKKEIQTQSNEEKGTAQKNDSDGAGKILESVYLLALFRGNVKLLQRPAPLPETKTPPSARTRSADSESTIQ